MPDATPQTDMERFVDLLGRFDHAMLVTRRGSELRSRPMAVGGHTNDGRIRFITRDDSPKLRELEEHAQVNVAMQGNDKYLSISGNARISKDRTLIDKAWKSSQSVWFSEGRDDPHVVVLEVIPTYAEYWDRVDEDVMELVLDAARSALAGRDDNSPEAGREHHGDVNFRDKPL